MNRQPLRNNRPGRPGFLAGLVLAGLFLIAMAGAARAQTYETLRSVNLRQGPSDEFPVVRALEDKERVEKIGGAEGYLQVRTQKGEEGYVWASYLKRIADTNAAPGFDEFMLDLEAAPAAATGPGPGKYFFESILEFLRIENQPLYVILLTILVALGCGVGGALLLRAWSPRLEGLVPPGVQGARRQAVKAVFLAVGIYLVITATAYFLDLSLHSASKEENTVLVMILAVPRLVLAAPVVLADALTANWVIGLIALFVLILIAWPGFRSSEPRETTAGALPTITSFPPSSPGKAGTLPPTARMETPLPGPENREPRSGSGPAAPGKNSSFPRMDEVPAPETRIVADDDESGPQSHS